MKRGADGDFPVTRAATKLMHDLRRKKSTTISPALFRMWVKTPHQTRIHVSLGLRTTESLFDLAKYRFWSGEATPGVRRPVFIRVCTAYSISAT